MTRKPCEHYISQINVGNFTQFWSQMYLGLHMYWLPFGIKGQNSRSLQQAMTRKTGWIQYLRNYFSQFHQN